MTRGVSAATCDSPDAWAESIREIGYVVAVGLLGGAEVDALREAFPRQTPGSTLHVGIDDRRSRLTRWRRLAEHPQITMLLARALRDYVVRLQGRDPGRGAGAQGLHADRPPGGVHECDGITLLWMLDEFDTANGATLVVPRSHRGAAGVPRRLAQPGLVHPDERIIIGRPGDVLIFDAHLWHSGRKNVSDARRRVVQ